MILKIFLTNLGAYNRGELLGEWIELPMSEEELQEAEKRVLAMGEPGDEELFITDYETEYFGQVNEYDGLFWLNEMAERIQEAIEYHGKEVVLAVAREYMDIKDVLDLLDSESFCVVQSIYSTEDLGHYIVEAYHYDDISDSLIHYLNYEAIGRDALYEGWVIHSDLGVAVYFD